VVHPIKNPLEIVAFNSSNEISIANNGSIPVYVIGLTVETEVPKEAKYFGIGLDIASGKIEKFHVGDGMPKVKALHRFGTTWDEYYQKALTLYQSCGIQLTFFSPTDQGFLELKDVMHIGESPNWVRLLI
jgi:hypothetical protein